MYVLSISRFKWNMSKLPGDFSIAPAAGYCSPGMDVNLVVSFRPTRHDSLIEGNVSVYTTSTLVPVHTNTRSSAREPRTFRAIYAKHKSGLLRHIVHLSLYFYIVFNFSK